MHRVWYFSIQAILSSFAMPTPATKDDTGDVGVEAVTAAPDVASNSVAEAPVPNAELTELVGFVRP